MTESISSRISLTKELSIPPIGLGTYALRGSTLTKVLSYALKIGYRLIDTASFYGNEKEIGDVIRESEINRDEIIITSKVWNTEQGYESTLEAFERSRKKLQVDYIDLYLIHWPVPVKRKDTWKALEHLYDEGLCRAIGVSNYYIPHLNEILENAGIIPFVNQVEFNPFLNLTELLIFCKNNNILLEAYSPLTNGYMLHHEGLKKLAEKYHKTTAQLMLRWCIQTGVVPIPKSQRLDRIEENASVFDFSIDIEDMQTMNSWNQNLHTDWDPSDVH
ncbi:MAG: aldo/keto reductase [Candidatus Lokiarchaeota archaeon]|nr:aldo/keto reductase [Candidatus Harpocratesius repetitus]